MFLAPAKLSLPQPFNRDADGAPARQKSIFGRAPNLVARPDACVAKDT
jgi:hypothetical protein